MSLNRPNIKITLPVVLTKQELDDRRDLLAGCVHTVMDLERKKAVEVKKWTDEIKREQAQLSTLARQIRDKSEDRTVDCSWRADIDHKQWTLYRNDTGEVVREETMTKEELQTVLSFQDDRPAKKPRKPD